MRRIAAALLTVLASSCVLGAASSGASAAPLPYLAIDCTQDVHALQGQPIVLSRLAVSGYVGDAITKTAKTLPAVTGLAGATAFDLGLGVTVGAVGTHDGTVPGSDIADAVVAAARSLPQFDSAREAGLKALRDSVTKNCGMTVHVLNGTAADDSEQQGPDAGRGDLSGAVSSTGYKNPDQLWLYTPTMITGGGRAPMRDYGTIPAAAPGVYAPAPAIRYGGAVPGYTPQFGLIGALDDTAMRTVGDARALPVTPSGGIALPILLAVLALSVVTGTLVRTWVLRRA